MKGIRLLAVSSVLICVSIQAFAGTWYVDGSVASSGDGTSWETAFQKIQEGVDAAADGDTVIVAPATYCEGVYFDGKAIHVVSRGGPAETVIDARRSGSGATFDGREGPDAVLEGFSITGAGGSQGGSGVYCDGSSPTIVNCRIFKNMSGRGGGIYCRDANPTILGCVIYSNWSHESGGGIWCYKSSPRIEGCTIVQNAAFYGGAGIVCGDSSPVILNCTIYGNLSPWSGGGIGSSGGSPLLINTIVWGNQRSDIEVSEGTVELRHCVYDPSARPPYGEFIDGGGNIPEDPLFTKPFMPIPHLSGDSPCIDAGLTQDLSAMDIDGEPRVTGGKVDIGADEYLDSDTDGLPDWWELWHFFDPVVAAPERDSDRDGASNAQEYLEGRNPAASSPAALYVDGAIGNDSWNGKRTTYVGGTVGPKATIQAAIDAAFDGDEIAAAPGTYEERITFAGKNLRLRSASGREVTVIQSPGGGAVVTLAMGEGREAILEGFGITGGGGYTGGGFDCFRSSPTIRDCAVYDNHAAMEAGGFFCLESSPLIEHCEIYNNSTEERGAAIHCDKCDPTIRSCNIYGNEIGCCGPAGIYLNESGGLVADCKLHHNTSPGVGAVRCDDSWTTFTRCAVYDNSSGRCSAFLLDSSPVTISNCAIYDNISDEPAVWCRGSSPAIINGTICGNICWRAAGVDLSESSTATLLNTIIWENKPYDLWCGEADPWPAAVLSHSNVGSVEGDFWDAGGNISCDPLLTRDFLPVPHLLPGSPCIDAGTWVNATPFDMEGDPRPQGPTCDIGADEFLDADCDGLPDWWETQYFGGLAAEAQADDDGDGMSNLNECARDYPPLHATPTTIYVNASSGDDRWDGTTRIHLGGTTGPKATVETAMEAALDGDIVMVLPGTYQESINFGGKRVHLLAPAGPERTIIDAGGAGTVVTFQSKETTESIIEGFGITGGNAENGGGIFCEKASPTITGCHVYGNRTPSWRHGHGAGLYCYVGSPAISDCRIYDNSTYDHKDSRGGGIYAESPSLRTERCIVEGNFSGGSGGGISLSGSNITLTECTIRNNVASQGWGGGIDCQSANPVTISNCSIRGNKAADGGGVCLYTCHDGVLSNCIIAGNSSTESGGGISCAGGDPLISGCLIFGNTAGTEGGGAAYFKYSRPRMVNCTVVGNGAQEGCEGIHYASNSVIYNCIVWGNGDDLSGCTAKYSCIEDIGDENEGEGVIHDNPLFVYPEREDFHLRHDSPCVDSGTLSCYYGLPAFDMDSEYRPFGATMDMGADEYLDQDFDALADYWETQWFGDLWASGNEDPDGDNLVNAEELVRLCDPTNADTDGDGHTDGNEVIAGMSPVDAGSRFHIFDVRASDEGVEIECSAVAGRTYRVMVSGNLVEWTPGDELVTATSDTVIFIDTTQSSNIRFYRVEVLP